MIAWLQQTPAGMPDALDFIWGTLGALGDNCAVRTDRALYIGGFGYLSESPHVNPAPNPLANFPKDVGVHAAQHAAQVIRVNLGASVPDELSVFNPEE
jgi:hypothetical protein